MIRPNHLTGTLAAVAICLTVVASSHAQAMNFAIDGVPRQALILAPANTSQSSVRLPLVFAFHGHGGNMIQTAAQMRFDKVWPEAIVVYMQGLPTKTAGDPDGDQPGWQHEPGEYGDRDLKFFDAVLAKLRHVLPVDDNRVYATGFSNGAIFTYLLWGTRAKTFAALAPVAGEKFPEVHLSVPIPLLHIAGVRDANVPFEQQLQTIAVAREVNRTTGSGHSCGEYCTAYDSSSGAPVIAYIHPAGHVYPRYASEMIVDFFKQHRRGETESRAVPRESATKSQKLPLQ
jgi:polyhydroxybutyrate depolymerase